MDRDAARVAVRRAVDASGLNRSQFADKAKVDPGTLADMLDGVRWPHSPTRAKIEKALRWPAGTIMDIAEGVISAPPGESAGPLIDAIRNDPWLLPEAKEHLERQYGLLRRIQTSTHPAAVEAENEDSSATVRSIKAQRPRGRPRGSGETSE